MRGRGGARGRRRPLGSRRARRGGWRRSGRRSSPSAPSPGRTRRRRGGRRRPQFPSLRRSEVRGATAGAGRGRPWLGRAMRGALGRCFWVALAGETRDDGEQRARRRLGPTQATPRPPRSRSHNPLWLSAIPRCQLPPCSSPQQFERASAVRCVTSEAGASSTKGPQSSVPRSKQRATRAESTRAVRAARMSPACCLTRRESDRGCSASSSSSPSPHSRSSSSLYHRPLEARRPACDAAVVPQLAASPARPDPLALVEPHRPRLVVTPTARLPRQPPPPQLVQRRHGPQPLRIGPQLDRHHGPAVLLLVKTADQGQGWQAHPRRRPGRRARRRRRAVGHQLGRRARVDPRRPHLGRLAPHPLVVVLLVRRSPPLDLCRRSSLANLSHLSIDPDLFVLVLQPVRRRARPARTRPHRVRLVVPLGRRGRRRRAQRPVAPGPRAFAAAAARDELPRGREPRPGGGRQGRARRGEAQEPRARRLVGARRG